MNFQQTKEALVKLGQSMRLWAEQDEELLTKALIQNPWFTTENTKLALNAWSDQLQGQNIDEWLDHYKIEANAPKRIAIIMAGNIPMVGLHDLICVLVTGHVALVKLSTDDTPLMERIITELRMIEPDFNQRIELISGKLPEEFDAVIATGSNNTHRYFEYYFRDKPHLLRKNRSSIAVLTGAETSEELQLLGKDIFTYFGLGCRNVSKLYVPIGYNFNMFFEQMIGFVEVANHNKYANNHTYHGSIYLMNSTPFLDNGYLLLREYDAISSPLSVVYFSYYQNQNELDQILLQHEQEIQCKVGKLPGFVPFGRAQFPELTDYADGVDTLSFIIHSISA